MHTAATFVVSFPEFVGCDEAALTAKLAEAALLIDAEVWGDFAESGHGYLTAHLMAMSPLGNTAKLVADKTTTYEGHYKRLLRIATAGIRST